VIGAALGAPFMPHQQRIADVAGEYDPATGIPFYDEVVVLMPRRGGKTHTVLSYQVERCLGWGKRQVGAYTAQDGGSARKILLDDQVPILESSPLGKTVRRVRRANDNTGITFKNGSQIDVLPSSDTAGHGRTFDFAIADEAFADTDARREASLQVPLATKRDAQFLIVSTAGTQRSVWLHSKREMGRHAALEDKGHGIAYFEWSAPDDADPDDPATWWDCHPALGYILDEKTIASRRASMDDGEFRRAWLNQWTNTDERIIPSHTWDAVNGPKHAGKGRMFFGVDVSDDRSAAAVVAVSEDRVVELVEHRTGLAWLLDRCAEMDQKHPGATWVVDSSGPVGSLAHDLERRVRTVHRLKGGDLAKASAAFYDAIADATVKVRRDQRLDDAVAGAARRVSGDAWAWSRKAGTTDSSPLVAATVALWVLNEFGTSVYEDRGLVTL
jgi:phage terminase large subunit-like protein